MTGPVDSHPWLKLLQPFADERLAVTAHGNLGNWKAAVDSLPNIDAEIIIDGRFVSIESDTAVDIAAVESSLRGLHPWRKGPFAFFGIEIDTEWRSDWKWNRISGRVPLDGAQVLDIGCGNGYYGWRMLADGARSVLGIDPTPLFNIQFAAANRYAATRNHHVFPVTDIELPEQGGNFDVTFSMGVLYHRTSPIDHLRTIASTLRPGGTAVVETLIVDDPGETVLVPKDRYAQMRNVWMIPSIKMLTRWLHRTGFESIEVLDDCVTTTEEQRSTPWMTFHSLSEFLAPSDSMLTVEGYPAPRRAVLMAKRKR